MRRGKFQGAALLTRLCPLLRQSWVSHGASPAAVALKTFAVTSSGCLLKKMEKSAFDNFLRKKKKKVKQNFGNYAVPLLHPSFDGAQLLYLAIHISDALTHVSVKKYRFNLLWECTQLPQISLKSIKRKKEKKKS